MTRTMESFARVGRWPYAGSPRMSTNSLIRSSMSARDPSGLPNGPTGSSRRRLLPIFYPNPDRSPPTGARASRASAPDKVSEPRETARPDAMTRACATATPATNDPAASWTRQMLPDAAPGNSIGVPPAQVPAFGLALLLPILAGWWIPCAACLLNAGSAERAAGRVVPAAAPGLVRDPELIEEYSPLRVELVAT